MKTIEVNGKFGSFIFNLPEELSEISKEYFEQCTDFVHPAPDYALVAIVYKDMLSLILTAAKNKKPVNASIIPIFIKAGTNNSAFINSLQLGDKIVVSGSDLSIGHHIHSPRNKITPNNIVRLCEGDTEVYKEALCMEPICLVEFKLIPISAIHSKLDNLDANDIYINPFVFSNNTNVSGGEA